MSDASTNNHPAASRLSHPRRGDRAGRHRPMASTGFSMRRFYESTDDAYVARQYRGRHQPRERHRDGAACRQHPDRQARPAPDRDGSRGRECEYACGGSQSGAHRAHGARRILQRRFSSSAQLAQAQVALAQAQSDYQRRQAASADGAVSGEELAHARDACRRPQAAVDAARRRPGSEPVASSGHRRRRQSRCAGGRSAVAHRRHHAGHMRIVAPVDGVVAQRTVQVGQQVAAGTPLMAVVPLSQCLGGRQFQGSAACSDMRIGQPVTVTADIYGGKRHLSRPCRRPGRRFGQRLRAAAAAECHRQLDQDRAARAGAHRARSRRNWRDHPLRVGLSVDGQRRCARHVRPAGHLRDRAAAP